MPGAMVMASFLRMSAASSSAMVPFWRPTSMVMQTRWGRLRLESLAIVNPRSIPARLSVMHAGPVSMAYLFTVSAPNLRYRARMTRARTVAEMTLTQGSALAAFALSKCLRNMPMRTGNTEMMKSFMMVERTGRETLVESSCCHVRAQPRAMGMVNGVMKPMTAVRDTDRPTSPLARKVKRLDVTPPGHSEMMMSPIASAPESWNRDTVAMASRGRRMSWQEAPMIKALGYLAMRLKSLISRLMPTPIMTRMSATGNRMVMMCSAMSWVVRGLYFRDSTLWLVWRHE